MLFQSSKWWISINNVYSPWALVYVPSFSTKHLRGSFTELSSGTSTSLRPLRSFGPVILHCYEVKRQTPTRELMPCLWKHRPRYPWVLESVGTLFIYPNAASCDVEAPRQIHRFCKSESASASALVGAKATQESPCGEVVQRRRYSTMSLCIMCIWNVCMYHMCIYMEDVYMYIQYIYNT